MRSIFKVLFYVNGSKEKNGVVPIMGRVTKSCRRCYYTCFLYVNAARRLNMTAKMPRATKFIHNSTIDVPFK